MLRTLGQLLGLEIVGEDGAIGSLEDVYFDPETWRLRHAVVFAGEWLPGRCLLLPVQMLRDIDPARRILRVAAARDWIGAAPAPETDRPVSLMFEKALYAHFDCDPRGLPADTVGAEPGRSRLLGVEELQGYRVEARDGDVGRLEDCLVEEEYWGIRYLCVATRRWFPGRSLAAPTAWIRLVDRRHKRVILRSCRDEIRRAPAFAGTGSLSAEFSSALDVYFAESGPVFRLPPYP